MAEEKQYILDEDRIDFIKKLDEANNIELSKWEADFVESMKEGDIRSDKQRAAIDKMIEKYRDALKW